MPKKSKSRQFRRPKRRRIMAVESSVEIQEQHQGMNKNFSSKKNVRKEEFVVESLLLLADADRDQSMKEFDPNNKIEGRCILPSEEVITVEHNYSSNLKSKVVDSYSVSPPNSREDHCEQAGEAGSSHPEKNENCGINDEIIEMQEYLILDKIVQEDIVKENIAQEEIVEYSKDACADLGLLNLPKEKSKDHNMGNFCPQNRTECLDYPNVMDEKIAVNPESVGKFISEFQAELPPLWIPLIGNDGTLHLLRLSCHESKVTQRSINIERNGQVKLFVHGRELEDNHEVFKELPSVKFRSSQEFSSSVIRILDHFRSFDFCHGVPQKKFQSLWDKTPGSFIDKNDFHEVRFDITCRSEDCCMILPYIKKRCQNCGKILKFLSRQKLPENAQDSIEPRNKLCPIKYLNSAEKDARIKEMAKIIRSVKNANKRLREKLNKFVDSASIQDNENQPVESQVLDTE